MCVSCAFQVHKKSVRLNAAIKPIWDHLDAGVHKIIEDEIRPALQQRLGRMGHLAFNHVRHVWSKGGSEDAVYESEDMCIFVIAIQSRL